jgi:hypothetical protein
MALSSTSETPYSYIAKATTHNLSPTHFHYHLLTMFSSTNVYLLSTNKKCSAAYPSTKKTPHTTPSPATSLHNANTSKPKLLRIALPGTSMLRPYFLSTRDK